MNGKFVSDATSVQNSVTLAGVIDAPWMKTSDKIETLYLAALSRRPRPQEVERLVKYVDQRRPQRRQGQGAGRRVLGVAQ